MVECKKLLDYNLIDVEGLVLLDKTFNIIEDQFEQAELVVGPPEDGIFASKLHDHDMIRDFRNEVVFDTKWQDWHREPLKSKKEIGDKFTINLRSLEEQSERHGVKIKYESLQDIHKVGGYVPPPLRAGMFEWVCVIDFNKQYPNAIMSTNAGIRTAIKLDHYDNFFVYDTNGKKWNRKELIETPIGFFRKDVESINNKKFQKWLKFRKIAQKKTGQYLNQVKDQEDPFWKLLDGKQFRIKIFTNGGFGIMGLKQDRNYSQFVFNNATITCQDLTMKMIQTIKELGYDVVSGDTDSCFPILKSNNLEDAIIEAKELARKVNEVINEYLNEVYNIQEHTMNVEVETISDKFYVKAAKNYVKRNLWKDGTILEEPQLEIKGISMKKRNTSRISADMQGTLIDILYNSQSIEDDAKLLIDVIDKNFIRLPWTYLAPKGAINNELHKYDISNRNARGARNAQKYFNKRFNPGDNPFIMPFKTYPKKLNGKFVSPYDGENLVLSFDEEDIPKIKEAGFVPNWKELKRSQIFLKAEPFLSLLNTDYYKLKAKTMVGDDMVL